MESGFAPSINWPTGIVSLGGQVMGIKRYTPEEIVTKLRQVEVLVGQGVARIAAI